MLNRILTDTATLKAALMSRQEENREVSSSLFICNSALFSELEHSGENLLLRNQIALSFESVMAVPLLIKACQNRRAPCAWPVPLSQQEAS